MDRDLCEVRKTKPCRAQGQGTLPTLPLERSPRASSPLRKPRRRTSANQEPASLISLMLPLANLIPNKKMEAGRGGRGIRVNPAHESPAGWEGRTAIGRLRPQRRRVCLNDLLQTPSWRREEATPQLPGTGDPGLPAQSQPVTGKECIRLNSLGLIAPSMGLNN